MILSRVHTFLFFGWTYSGGAFLRVDIFRVFFFFVPFKLDECLGGRFLRGTALYFFSEVVTSVLRAPILDPADH